MNVSSVGNWSPNGRSISLAFYLLLSLLYSKCLTITVFLKKVGREHRIPFEISADPFYSESNMRYLTKVIDGIEDGTRPLTEHELIEVDDE